MAEALAHTPEHADHPHPNYMAVFWLLFGLTVVEVAISLVHMNHVVLIVLLMVLAFAKAIMVALYFMHLRYDNKILTIMAAVPVVLAAIAVTILAAEYSSYTISDTARTKQPPALEEHE